MWMMMVYIHYDTGDDFNGYAAAMMMIMMIINYDEYEYDDDDTSRGTQSYECPAPALPCRADSETGQIFKHLNIQIQLYNLSIYFIWQMFPFNTSYLIFLNFILAS